MVNLVGDKVILRALEPGDLDILYNTENKIDLWYVSDTVTPFSKHILKQYIDESHRDIYDAKQLRLAICLPDNAVIGFIDLFDFNAQHRRAGIGLVIVNELNRSKGYAKDALKVLINYSFSFLQLHQLYCDITEDNNDSLNLFKSVGFNEIGVKKDWVYTNGTYKSVLMFQIINA
ncbi:GNAT family N-acetyltransferase [Paucihalobacter ruber]|uniref:GNAT family N-acetyltransferase n=1 Tax=Paucihalobacter ruber TaxID=2567861 RepID=A0A506PEK4_9FLAO|nr:GNAT family protein [Paucihalobacter ruber]TPV32266.1 GNAT family N-acetyltransferase [Paucihalobacter ruber]